MRILLLSPIYPPHIGGPAAYAEEISRRLTPTHDMTVIAYAEETARAYGSARLITISTLSPLPVRLLRFFLAAYREAKDVDVIYVQNAVAAGLPGILAGLLRRKPVIIKFVGDEAWERATQSRTTTKRLEEFMADPDGSRYARLIMAVQRWVLRRATIVTTPSAYLSNALVREYGVRDSRAITNYNATREHVPSAQSVVRRPHQLLVAARLTAWKGVDGILRALTLVRRTHPDTTLVIAGDGPERAALERLTVSLDLSDAVTFLGAVPHERVIELLAESELFVLNSTYEGLPHTILDAFSARCGVVATDIPGTNEAVTDGVSGITVPPGDDARLADAIVQLFEDGALRERMIDGGLDTLERFTWERHITNLMKIFERARAR